MNAETFAMYTVGITTVMHDDLPGTLYHYLVSIDQYFGEQLRQGVFETDADLPKLQFYNRGTPWVDLGFFEAHALAKRIGLFAPTQRLTAPRPALQYALLLCLWESVVIFTARRMGLLKVHAPLDTLQ